MKIVGSLIFLTLALAATPAYAALTISAATTQNVTCSAGVCSATAPDAVLNVSDLGTMLASSPMQVISGSDAQDIVVAAPLSWSSANGLTLDSYRSLTVQQPVSDAGSAALTINTNDGGTGGDLSFGAKGRVSFASTANKLTIDGKKYMLASSIAQMAANIAAKPRGFHALANNYDASADGSYSRVPIQTDFAGTFEGLGNTISNFAMYDTEDNYAALFESLKPHGVLRNLALLNVNIFGENGFVNYVAPLLGYNAGTVIRCQATGAIRSDFRMTGGGLVALSYGTIEQSFADVFVSGAETAEVGGLVGNAHGKVTDVYATGQVIAGDDSDVGGLIGYFIGNRVTRGYSTGQVSGGHDAIVGGFVGENQSQFSNGEIDNSYWDVVTSGTSKGAGTGDATGITGLTTEQLQSGIPEGFRHSVWAEKKKVNGGVPYLIANPPR